MIVEITKISKTKLNHKQITFKTVCNQNKKTKNEQKSFTIPKTS